MHEQSRHSTHGHTPHMCGCMSNRDVCAAQKLERGGANASTRAGGGRRAGGDAVLHTDLSAQCMLHVCVCGLQRCALEFVYFTHTHTHTHTQPPPQELIDKANEKMVEKLAKDSKMGETSQLLPPEVHARVCLHAHTPAHVRICVRVRIHANPMLRSVGSETKLDPARTHAGAYEDCHRGVRDCAVLEIGRSRRRV